MHQKNKNFKFVTSLYLMFLSSISKITSYLYLDIFVSHANFDFEQNNKQNF